MSESVTLTDEDVELLNTPLGLKYLMAKKKTDVLQALKLVKHELAMRELHVEMIHLQQWVIRERQRVVVLFEGRDAAGKGGTIRQLTAHINPRHYESYALPKPTEDERGQWYFQRYVNCLPNPGEMAFFDRSWYNRAMVEPVNGFCSQEEYQQFMEQVNDFEKMLVSSGIFLIKFYLSITREEQVRRFEAVQKSPLKRWQLSEVDSQAQKLWKQYSRYKNRMLENTDTDHAPWVVIDANDNTLAHQTAMKFILDTIPYEVEADGI